MIIQILNAHNGDIHCDVNEALRYMGYGKSSPDNSIKAVIEQCRKQLEAAADFKCCYTIQKLKILSENSLDIGFGKICSSKLCKHLQGCNEIAVFAATIGINADRLIKKYSISSPSKSVITDALASSLIEQWCDKINSEIVGGRKCKSRFSAGYGDFDIKYQNNILSFLNASKHVGITATKSCMMIPAKSVTAIIGICNNVIQCGDTYDNKCMNCDNINCEYRNEN